MIRKEGEDGVKTTNGKAKELEEAKEKSGRKRGGGAAQAARSEWDKEEISDVRGRAASPGAPTPRHKNGAEGGQGAPRGQSRGA